MDGVEIISIKKKDRKPKITLIIATDTDTGIVTKHGSVVEFARHHDIRYDMAWPLCDGRVSHHRGITVEVTRG